MKQLNTDWVGVSVSHGTLREEDLIPAFEDVIIGSGNELPRRTINATNFLNAGGCSYIRNGGYESYDMARQDTQDYLEKLFDLLNEIAPARCIFGSHEGDGTNFGFWRIEEATENTGQGAS